MAQRGSHVGAIDRKVLQGPKTPHWACGLCGADRQCASRIECRVCGRAAPASICKRAREADSTAAAAAKQARASRPGQTHGNASFGGQQASPSQRSETQRLRRELATVRAELERVRETGTPNEQVGDAHMETASGSDESEATIAQLERALAGLDAKSDATADLRESIKQRIAHARAEKLAKQPDHVRRQGFVQKRRRQQESLQSAKRQIEASDAAIAAAEEGLVELRKKGDALRERRAALEVSISSLDAQISELSSNIASPQTDRYDDLPEGLAEQYRALDALAAQARAAAAAERGPDSSVAGGPPMDGGPAHDIGNGDDAAAVNIPDDDDLLDTAMEQAGIAQPGADAKTKRMLLESYNMGAKRQRVSATG